MPLPQKVVEQLGRAPVSTPGWSSRLLMFSSTVFFIALVVYLGITFGYKPYVESDVQKLTDQMNSFSQEVPKEDQDKIFGFYSQLASLKNILKNHIVSSQIIDWLEQNTHASVFFSSFSFDNQRRAITLSGSAKSIPEFIEQIHRFQQDQNVDKVSFQRLTYDALIGWQFDMVVTLNQTAFLGTLAATAPAGGTNEASGTTP
ncbi:MAG TPA: hypothetical protein VMC43_03255 [Candidatus Paceibacterota bacterium]|nr:hypothetical protein [Candidatus Paceibacterota bacterium]